ncbi:diphthine--ammonia ligase [Candidatus Woesearchaeota archaeon]|nr:diphthine--ammonia ligase [Candidatus Woesearchaeota archaeon]
MCGIMGIFGTKYATSSLVHGLSMMANRGQDGYGISDGHQFLFEKKLTKLREKTSHPRCAFADKIAMVGHCLHSIVGFVPQPLLGKGTLVVNSEIYNWQTLAKKYGFSITPSSVSSSTLTSARFSVANDAELLLKLLDTHSVEQFPALLEELDGVYAFAYWRQNTLILARDILGVKPLWYATQPNFAFASERKVLEVLHYYPITEVNPRKVLLYTPETGIQSISRSFFTITPEHTALKRGMEKELWGLLTNAIAKRIPDQPFGILFSGGIDSTIIASICQQLGLPFTCYTAALAPQPGQKTAEDLIMAKKVAEHFGFKLKTRIISLQEMQAYLPKVVPLIEDTNVVKVGVALPFYLACEIAKKEGIKVMFSGLGSEELFAGYERHKNALLQEANVNKECLSGLLKLYERDTYRDDVVTMHHGIELRLPFLDKDLVTYALKIPTKYKLDGPQKEHPQSKKILRDTARQMGIPEEIAMRKKRAAQYGSNVDKGLAQLAKQQGFSHKSAYLQQFLPRKNLTLGVLFSSGKDSCFAMYVMHRQNYEIACLITIKSNNPDSYMFHTPNIDLADLQAQALGIPLVVQITEGQKEEELQDLYQALYTAREKYHLDGIITGALYSTYQRDRIEHIGDTLGLKIFSPLWHMHQEEELKMLIDNNFVVLIGAIAAEGLDEHWLGRKLDAMMIEDLRKLHEKYGLNIAGEGGEFESLVLDCPMFHKRIEIVKATTTMESVNRGRYIVHDARLV